MTNLSAPVAACYSLLAHTFEGQVTTGMALARAAKLIQSGKYTRETVDQALSIVLINVSE